MEGLAETYFIKHDFRNNWEKASPILERCDSMKDIAVLHCDEKIQLPFDIVFRKWDGVSRGFLSRGYNSDAFGIKLGALTIEGEIIGYASLEGERRLQLNVSKKLIQRGMSGCPIFSKDQRAIIGMVSYFAGMQSASIDTIIAIPIENIILVINSNQERKLNNYIFKKNPSNELEIFLPNEGGPSTHIATDRWTLDDTLGFEAYAHAIYRFMTHKETFSPVTISIQAPWGGGKTSLMRMIQKKLDPEHPDLKTEEDTIQRKMPLVADSITISQVFEEINEWTEGKVARGLPNAMVAPSSGTESEPHRLTIWFNAWKYQSTNEVWSGLADAIIHQVTARLTPSEREQFWLRLNLKRLDTDKIRRQIHERILNYTVQKAIPWLSGASIILLISLGIALEGWANQSIFLKNCGALGIALSAVGGSISFLASFNSAKEKVNNEPAAISLSEYLQMPDYRSELGFIHHVEADLRRVFASVPSGNRPFVVFIDDLDRCSPEKVAELVGGINLFLAGDFPECMFIIGMDAEMVAAALESAHASVISCLPLDASSPIGWRFMDKFVQLPFVIPPSDYDQLQRYTSALIGYNKIDQNMLDLAMEISPKNLLESIQNSIDEKGEISFEQKNQLNEQIRNHVLKTLNRGIETFNDENKEIREMIIASASNFSHNPRELKRFINAFRFQYFVCWARRAQGMKEEVPLSLLQRWVLLATKWPQVMRWIQHTEGRLKQLELMGESATNLEKWLQNGKEITHLDEEKNPWIRDDALREFFYNEYNIYPEGKRISNGMTKGLF